MQSVYKAAGGSDGLLRLAEAWHKRVMADEIVSHAFSSGFRPDHSQRLAAYWAEALGGPASYSARYGDETSVVRIHSGNGEHAEMDQRAITCFDQAMADIGLYPAGPLGHVLHDYFAWATTTTMARYHESADDVPERMTIPQFLRRVRMERAAELLRAGRHNVTEAAFAVGYSSLGHFSKSFCEVMGCCPTLYPQARHFARR